MSNLTNASNRAATFFSETASRGRHPSRGTAASRCRTFPGSWWANSAQRFLPVSPSSTNHRHRAFDQNASSVPNSPSAAPVAPLPVRCRTRCCRSSRCTRSSATVLRTTSPARAQSPRGTACAPRTSPPPSPRSPPPSLLGPRTDFPPLRSAVSPRRSPRPRAEPGPPDSVSPAPLASLGGSPPRAPPPLPDDPGGTAPPSARELREDGA